jgi:SAM-dependent methyltransferase
LPLHDNSIDYISSQHALPALKVWNQLDALSELRRVLKPGGVLRLCLPDLDLTIAAYQSGRQEYFSVWAWDTISGNFMFGRGSRPLPTIGRPVSYATDGTLAGMTAWCMW